MIRYDLVCTHGHAFDGWFPDSDSYETQARRGLLACATCGTAEISKQLMAPRIGLKSNRKDEAKAPVFSAPADPRARALLRMMRELRQTVAKNADYVGDRFAQEARRIHYEEAEQRGIYGEATADDARSLVEEGIEIHPLPRLPEDGN